MGLNREQIIKALECCTDFTFGGCDNCAFDGTSKSVCIPAVMRGALALINELTEENKKIGIENFDLICKLSRIKADTVREMQSEIKERCIKGGIYPAFVKRTIDQIAKEMLEGKDD